MDITITANIVAWYGAILSTLSIVFVYLNYARDKAKIKIELHRNMYLHHPSYQKREPYAELRVTNVGRRPIYILTASMKAYGDDKWMQPVDSIKPGRPLVIDEQNPWTSMYTLESILKDKEIYLIRVVDGAGRRYDKYLYSFPTLRIYLLRLKKWFWLPPIRSTE